MSSEICQLCNKFKNKKLTKVKLDLVMATFDFGLEVFPSSFNVLALCCVFGPANGCSACRLLVEIICFCVKTSFSSFSITNEKNKGKRKNNTENLHKRGSTSV